MDEQNKNFGGVSQIVGESFEIIEPLGCGSSGTVYKARHLRLDRLVALKVLSSTDAVSLARFHREAQIMALLVHKNVCQCFQFGVEKGVPFMVLELIEAPTLRTILSCKQLGWKESSGIGIQICAGLQAAHEMGVIHRDIKPDNIMLMPDGTAKILDFGLSGFDSAASQKLTQTNVTLGTPLYMSPEQCTSGNVDHRSDIYGLGCLLFECVMGTPPFSGETAFSVMMQHEAMPVPPMGGSTIVPSGYESIICKALSKDPNRRYQSAKDFGRALSNLLDDPGTPLPTPRQGLDISLQKDWRYVLPSAVAVTLIGGFVWVLGPALKIADHETEDSANGLLQGSRQSMAQVSRLYDSKSGEGKTEARKLYKKLILVEESKTHPDNHFLFDAYESAADLFDPPGAEPYLRKALVLGRTRSTSELMAALWLLSTNLKKQGEHPEKMLLELLSMARAGENQLYIGRANALLCREYILKGRLVYAENCGVQACTSLADSPYGDDGPPYVESIAMLMTLSTKEAIATSAEHLASLNKAQAQLATVSLTDQALQAKQPSTYIKFVNAVSALSEKPGAVPDPETVRKLVDYGLTLNLKHPASQEKILLALEKIMPPRELMWCVIGQCLDLVARRELAAAEALVNEYQRYFHQLKDWPYAYQAYLDKLYEATTKDELASLQNVLRLYYVNLPRLRMTCGPESPEYARALWQRAQLNRDANRSEAALRDFDECEAIVAKRNVAGLDLMRVQAARALVVQRSH